MERMTADEVIKTYHMLPECSLAMYVTGNLMWGYCRNHRADTGVYLALPSIKSRYEVAMAERRN